MKAKLKYHFSRLAVLLLALHILDVSIDIDFATASSPSGIVENYDDVDSISEFIIEGLFHNNNLVAEADNDDHQHDHHKLANPYASVFYYVEQKNDLRIDHPAVPVNTDCLYTARNTTFLFEDYTHALYTPPDFITAKNYNS